MARVRVVHNKKAYAALLKDAAVLADVRRRAERIAAAAGPEFDVQSSEPRVRARAAVIAPQGDPDNKMIRSLDAGR